MLSFPCHLVFHTKVNLSHLLNSIEFSYRTRVYCEHLTILNYKEITSAFHLLPSLQLIGETSWTLLPHNKNIKTFCKVSWSPARLRNIWKYLVGRLHFKSFYFKNRERKCSKNACRLLYDNEPLDNNSDQLGLYTCQTDRKFGLGPQGSNGALFPCQWTLGVVTNYVANH